MTSPDNVHYVGWTAQGVHPGRIVCLLVLLAAALYVNSLSAPFIFDDWLFAAEDGIIRLSDLPREVLRAAPRPSAPEPVASPLDDAERTALLNALESQRWHMTRTAEQLGISRNTLYRKLRKHAIATRG